MSDSKKILLIDDDADFLEGNKVLLESQGYDVYVSTNGQGGFDKAMEIRPDLVIIDVMMKHNTEGIDISRKIAACNELKGTPILLLTGIRKAMHIPFKLEPDDEWLPVKAVLEKPIQPDRFLEKVEQALA